MRKNEGEGGKQGRQWRGVKLKKRGSQAVALWKFPGEKWGNTFSWGVGKEGRLSLSSSGEREGTGGGNAGRRGRKKRHCLDMLVAGGKAWLKT